MSTEAGAADGGNGYDSDGRASTPSLELSDDGGPRRQPQNPSQMALPTMLMAGTILGSIFRADLSKNRVDVETNNLRKELNFIQNTSQAIVLLNLNFIAHLGSG